MRVDELTEEQIIQINKLRVSGFGSRSIAKQLNITEWVARTAPLTEGYNKSFTIPKMKQLNERNKLIIKYYWWEFKPSEIAKILECSSSYVLTYLDKNNLPHDLWKIRRSERIVKLRIMGYSMSQIAEDYNLTQSAVLAICKKNDVAGVMANHETEIRRCKECNSKYIVPVYSNKIFCSEACQKHNNHSKNDIKRRIRKKNSLVDSDITLKKLFIRDNGICQICGLPTDWEDIVYVDGKIHSSKNYPTIDHIKPLINGGAHSWDNIQLAHLSCNSSKGIKEVR